MSRFIEIEQDDGGGVATIFFSDAARGNQLCWAAVDELAEALCTCRESGVRVIVLGSRLKGHWFEHAWLEDLCAGVEGRPRTGVGDGWFRTLQELSHESVISIAAISGDCSGGGAELGWACDLRVAERQARFAQIEVNAGLTTGIGGCSRLMRLVGPACAADMVLTGRAVSARRLYELGAITRLVNEGESMGCASGIASQLAQKSPEALAGLKRILRRVENLPLDQALEFEQAVFQEVVTSETALVAMRACQAAYDRGESIASVHDYEGDSPDCC